MKIPWVERNGQIWVVECLMAWIRSGLIKATEDDMCLDIMTQIGMFVTKSSIEEMRLSEAITTWMQSAAMTIASGGEVSYDQIHEVMDQMATEAGYEYGLPVPALGVGSEENYLIVAKGVPLRGIIAMNQMDQHVESAQRIMRMHGCEIRNSWRTLGDTETTIIQTDEGPLAWTEPMAGTRLRKLMDTMITRSNTQLSPEAEERAMLSLKAKVTRAQWRSYLLNCAFLEKSKRSNLFYLFRKGYPTLALSFADIDGKPSSGRCIAALCLHPMGYYAYTHAGLMTPTDEVIAALLLMRGDEHGFWKKSGQWKASDTRSGL